MYEKEMSEYSDSTMDGSLDGSYESGTPEPAVQLPDSPDGLFNMDFSATVPRHINQNYEFPVREERKQQYYNDKKGYEDEVHENNFEESSQHNHTAEHSHVFDSEDISQSFHLNVSTDLAGAPVLSTCNKISSFLSENGYPSVKLLSSDIDRRSGYEIYACLYIMYGSLFIIEMPFFLV